MTKYYNPAILNHSVLKIGGLMKTLITTTLKIEEHDYTLFRILCFKKKTKISSYLGDLVSAEIRKQIATIKGE